LRAVSIQASLGDDPNLAAGAIAELQAIRSRRMVLQHVLQAAEQAARDRLASLHAREWVARKRALAQHIGRAQRDAADVASALRSYTEALSRLTASGAAITALLPASMRSKERPFHELLGEANLRALSDLERFRISPTPSDKPKLLGQFEDRRTGTIKPLADILADMTTACRAEFDRAAPSETEPEQQQGAPKALVTEGANADA
jgi:hypothetical protein